MVNRLVWLIAVSIVMFMLAGCDEHNFSCATSYVATRSLEYPKSQPKVLSLSNLNGSVVVNGKSSLGVGMQMQITVRHRDADECAKIAETIFCKGSNNNGTITLKTVVPQKFQRCVSTSYIISVPETCRVEIKNTNGRISVAAVQAGALLENTNGKIELSNLRGAITASTTNGDLTIENVRGDVRATTSNGRIESTQTDGILRLRTKNGRISVREARSLHHPITCITSNSSISLERTSGAFELETTNGAISADVDHLGPVGEQSRAETTNGTIEISALRGQRLTIDASASNGRVQNELAAADPRNAQHTLVLRTTNGNITISESR